MDPRLRQSAEDGNVDLLYLILADDPYALERIDQIPFVDTPLHAAVRNGNSRYAMEITSLKPSFARKLNHLGLSPIHLALENGGCKDLITWFTTIDSELVRVKAKGMITPLHYAAEIEDLGILSIFLCICPSSINDLTVKYETAVQVALKNGKFSAFRLLFGWLRRVNMEIILKNRDEDGNDALHIATATNQPEVAKMLIGYVDLNTKNNSGLTALDIFYIEQDSLDAEVGNILSRAKAKRASELEASGSTTAKRSTLVGYLGSDLSFLEKMNKLGLPVVNYPDKLSNDFRNVVLVIAILIATTTYQAVLSPPGGFWQDNDNTSASASATIISNTTTGSVAKSLGHIAGKMILDPTAVSVFFGLNSAAFFTSICMILKVMFGVPFAGTLAMPAVWLSASYFLAMNYTFPSNGAPFVLVASLMLFPLLAIVCVFFSKLSRYRDRTYVAYGRWRVSLGGFI